MQNTKSTRFRPDRTYRPKVNWKDTRTRLTGVLFGGVALASTGHIAAVTVSTLAVDEITGSATLAGVPSASSVVGTALGTTLLTLSMARRGRRPGLVTGYASAILGSMLSLLALTTLSLPLLLVGMAFLGVGNASNALARYTAADMYPPERRGSALGLVVWASTVGSVLGPALLQPSGRLATDLGRSELAGGYVVNLAFMGLAALLYLFALRPDPAAVAVDTTTPVKTKGDVRSALSLPTVKIALTAMVTGQVVMVLIMTVTPLHIHHHGSDLGIVGLVMSAHTLGMFALSPVTGRLVDKFEAIPVALGGMGLLAVSALVAAYGPNDSPLLLVVALFALGFGWNLSFVAGSSLLTQGIGVDVRARLQGRVDSIAWGSGAFASVFSGVVYQWSDYRITSLVGLLLLALPVIFIWRTRRDAQPVAAT